MTFEEIKSMIDEMDFPSAYWSFPEKEAPELPYLIYYYPNSENFFADDHTYAQIERVNLELYTQRKNIEYERRVESVLTEYDIPFERNETYINSEHMYEVLFEFDVLIEGE